METYSERDRERSREGWSEWWIEKRDGEGGMDRGIEKEMKKDGDRWRERAMEIGGMER